MSIRYSKRHHRKLKPNRAQRNRDTAAFQAKGRGLVRQMSPIASILAPAPRPKSDRRGPQHGRSREAKDFRAQQSAGAIGARKPAPTGGLTHHATRRANLLAATLNQHLA